MLEYRMVAEMHAAGVLSAEELPLTPDPEDTSASKRQWESSVMQWRIQLKELVHGPGVRRVVDDRQTRQLADSAITATQFVTSVNTTPSIGTTEEIIIFPEGGDGS